MITWVCDCLSAILSPRQITDENHEIMNGFSRNSVYTLMYEKIL